MSRTQSEWERRVRLCDAGTGFWHKFGVAGRAQSASDWIGSELSKSPGSERIFLRSVNVRE
jgi:hypothetical protein